TSGALENPRVPRDSGRQSPKGPTFVSALPFHRKAERVGSGVVNHGSTVRCALQRQNAPARRRNRRLGGLGLMAALALVLSGCGAEFQRGYLPEPVTEIGDRVVGFWNWTWIAALAIGVLVWGLILWCVVAYRRKKDETGLPVQLRYNIPLEILYTIVPILMVAVLFGKTVELQHDMVDTSQPADVTVNAIGKKWSWDFNYV